MSLTDFAENKLLNLTLKNTAWTVASGSTYLGLMTAAPNENGTTNNEVSAAWYARKQPTSGWNVATTTGITNNGASTWSSVTGSSVTVSHVGLFDALSGGNLLWYIALTSPKLFGVGGTPNIGNALLNITVPTGGISNFLIPKWLDHMTGRAAYSPSASVYLAMYTSNPTAADSGTEIVIGTGGYARQAITFSTATTGTTSNSADISFGTASASLGNISHYGIKTAVTAGSLLLFGAWNSILTVDNGDTYKCLSGQLTQNLD